MITPCKTISRLVDDYAHARMLAEGIASLPDISIALAIVETGSAVNTPIVIGKVGGYEASCTAPVPGWALWS